MIYMLFLPLYLLFCFLPSATPVDQFEYDSTGNRVKRIPEGSMARHVSPDRYKTIAGILRSSGTSEGYCESFDICTSAIKVIEEKKCSDS